MGTEAQTENKELPAGGAAAGSEGAAAAGGQADQASQQEKKPKEQPAASQAPKRAVLGADDDGIPDDADLLELSKSALTARLNRHTRSELKKRFGTDDPEKIRKDLAELETLRTEKESKRQAELTEAQREKELREKAEQRAEVAERAVREERQTRQFERYDSKLTRVAESMLDGDYVDTELNRFAKHLRDTFDKKQLRKMSTSQTEAELKKFLDGRIKDKPKLAKDYDERRREEVKAELKAEARGEKRQPVTNGASSGNKPAAHGGGSNGEAKTFAPGKPNSMSEKEAREEMRRQGISYR